MMLDSSRARYESTLVNVLKFIAHHQRLSDHRPIRLPFVCVGGIILESLLQFKEPANASDLWLYRWPLQDRLRQKINAIGIAVQIDEFRLLDHCIRLLDHDVRVQKKQGLRRNNALISRGL